MNIDSREAFTVEEEAMYYNGEPTQADLEMAAEYEAMDKMFSEMREFNDV